MMGKIKCMFQTTNQYIWLVVLTILKNMKVNGKDDIPYIMENKIHVLNHQPVCLVGGFNNLEKYECQWEG